MTFERFNRFLTPPQLHPRMLLRFRVLDILCALLLLLALIVIGITPARSQSASTIFLTDRNGQIAFPFLPPNRATGGPASIDNTVIGATTPKNGFFLNISGTGSSCTATPCLYSGIAAAQGGAIQLKGGTSSTSGNAGGAAGILGGVPGATGAGGAASVAGGAGGATSGAGGAATVAGGAATTSGNGGLSALLGGAGAGTGNGGSAAVTAGASGAGATGAGGTAYLEGGASAATNGGGGDANVTGGLGRGTGNGGSAAISGGAGGSTSGNGGSVTLTPGVKGGTGVDGVIYNRGVLTRKWGPPAAKTTSGALAVGDLFTGITVTQGAGANSNQQAPTGTAIQNALPVDFAAGDTFDVNVINLGAASETATLTVNTDVTIVGAAVVAVGASGTFRFRKSADHVFVAYRIN